MKFSDIQDKSLVDLESGSLLGKVHNLLISTEDQFIKLIELELPGDNLAASAYLPYFEVSGFYSYALTVKSASLMKAYQSIADLREDLPDVTDLIGKRVLSTRGNLLGNIVDFYYDDDNYQILILYAAKSDNSERIVCYLQPYYNINDSFVLIDESQCLLESSLSQGNAAGEYAAKILEIISQSEAKFKERSAANLNSATPTSENVNKNSNNLGTVAENSNLKVQDNQEVQSNNGRMNSALPGGFRYANYQGRAEVFSNFLPNPQGEGYVDLSGKPYVASQKYPDQFTGPEQYIRADNDQETLSREELPIAREYAVDESVEDPYYSSPNGTFGVAQNPNSPYAEAPNFQSDLNPKANDEDERSKNSEEALWDDFGDLYAGFSGQLDPTVSGAVSTPMKHLMPQDETNTAQEAGESVDDESSLFNEFAELYGI